MHITKKLISLFLLTNICSCSLQDTQDNQIVNAFNKTANNFWIKNHGSEELTNLNAEDENSTQTDLSPSVAVNNSVVELIWLVPKERVTKYILRYGTSPNNLDQLTEIPIRTLLTVMHPQFGKVHRFLIINAPNSTLYYTLQAGNELGLSEPTPIASEEPLKN